MISFLEARHFNYWVSFRDVGAGDNYQESITRALRAANVLILILTKNANRSVEIPKELSLASRYKLRVIPLRMEAVELSDALAYELTTHNWVDMFQDWYASCDRVLSQLSTTPPVAAGAMPVPRLERPVLVRETKPACSLVEADPKEEGSVFIDFVKFSLVAVGLGLPLYSSLQQGEPSLLELFLWTILLIGSARLVGAILWGFVAVSRANLRRRTLTHSHSAALT